MQIGIAITTTPNRQHLHDECISNIMRHSPADTIIYTHNDIYGTGISKSKNACISALMEVGCTNLFLFDDDCYPVKNGWHLPFIKSGLNHSAVTFTHHSDGTPNKHKLLRTANGIDYFSNGCGIVLYYTRQCIEQIGGMDIRYQKWGYEHGGLSMRIKNAGLTNSNFLAPHGVMEYFYSHDQHKSARSVFTQSEKAKFGQQGITVAKLEATSRDWKPYRKADYVLTSFYTRAADQQRGGRFLPPDTNLLDTLINSAPCEVVCLTDIARPRMPKFKYVASVVEKPVSVYNWRFIEFYRWIKRNLEYLDTVYLLDATDTEFIGKPHKIEAGKVYVNYEPKGSLQWLLNEGKSTFGADILSKRGEQFLNAGVIYGKADAVLKLLEAMQPYLKKPKMIEMSTLNYLANTGIQGIEFVPVKSGFKSQDKENVYIRHK